MARGHQKIQSQQKNAKKQAEIKKSKGHDQKTAAKAALVYTCGVCRVPPPHRFLLSTGSSSSQVPPQHRFLHLTGSSSAQVPPHRLLLLTDSS
ncbi:hypothetical protein QTP70_027468 [Hemibagrus guttatus]|uniref:Small EDRK-rich factor-like N-terminal domain-containing protein n=1 Tax=Hemibagrus guttatus TaxID=175788 RepID=A0AAE0UNM7_9TELE|nr:hypothetical protein QTP70_027468 [Hemibagrus guttatus]